MGIFAVDVGLPYFDDGIGNGNAIAVKDASLNRDPLAEHAFARYVGRKEAFEANAAKRSNGLPCGCL
jgi:hypothetical protein